MDRRWVEWWVAGYEKAWRSPGTAMLGELFTPEVVYLPSPWAEPVTGLEALAEFWESERHCADERFAMRHTVVAVELDTAVVRLEVVYEAPPRNWRDLWVLTFAAGGRCARFEEWPFSPQQPDGH
jgi:hypothetical protein